MKKLSGKSKTKLSAVLIFVLMLIACVCLTGCAAPDGSDMGFDPGILDDATAPGGEEGGDGSDEQGGSQNTPIVKQLTGAEWRDALDYEFWLKLFEKEVETGGQEGNEQNTRNGIFYEYAKATRGLDTFEMHEVSVTCEGDPVVGATVKLYNDTAENNNENTVVYTAVSDSAGKAYVFGNGTYIEAVSGEYSAIKAVSDGVTEIDLAASEAYANEIEIMLVVDTTGSMGDELSFLEEELAGVITRVSSAIDCNIRLGLLFYRDIGDDYVTRKFDFTEVTTSAGLSKVVKNIKAQFSWGGGDYPEAVDAALSEAVAADWHTNSKTRLIFHVLDAPYHDEQENQSVFANAVKSAAQKGIRIIPVAASGLDTLGQYTMRSAALLTGGTYTFLTDDSGIGNSHILPAVGKFTVEYLSDLMVRLIKGYYTGTFEAPVQWTQSESVA